MIETQGNLANEDEYVKAALIRGRFEYVREDGGIVHTSYGVDYGIPKTETVLVKDVTDPRLVMMGCKFTLKNTKDQNITDKIYQDDKVTWDKIVEIALTEAEETRKKSDKKIIV